MNLKEAKDLLHYSLRNKHTEVVESLFDDFPSLWYCRDCDSYTIKQTVKIYYHLVPDILKVVYIKHFGELK